MNIKVQVKKWRERADIWSRQIKSVMSVNENTARTNGFEEQCLFLNDFLFNCLSVFKSRLGLSLREKKYFTVKNGIWCDKT